MAFELVGINPESHLGICVRFNVWHWRYLLTILRSFEVISVEEELSMMLNDCKISFDKDRSIFMSRTIRQKEHTILHPPEFVGNFGGPHFRYLTYFLDNCGGFYIR